MRHIVSVMGNRFLDEPKGVAGGKPHPAGHTYGIGRVLSRDALCRL